jgi:hypothetical protein
MDTNQPKQNQEQWDTVMLGFQGVPYPRALEDGSIELSTNYVPRINSLLTPEQVNGIAYREMPAPEHLNAFQRILDSLISPDGSRIFTFLSDPGIGKTHFANLLQSLMTGESPLLFECGDKRLSDLLFITDITQRPEENIYDRVLAKIREGKCSRQTVLDIKAALGAHFDPFKGTVNFEAAANDDEVKTPLYDVFLKAATAEGLNTQSNLAFNERHGIIIDAYNAGRIALIDEYNKGKLGSDGALQNTLEWAARLKRNNHVVTSSSGQTIQLGPLNEKPGFALIVTGNRTTDGASTFDLSQSQSSRLTPRYLPNLGKDGLAHRFCQIMTGLPVSTLSTHYGPYFNGNEEGFTMFCEQLRVLGLSEREIERIPAHERALLKQPKLVVEAANHFADLFAFWQNTMDPDDPTVRESGTLVGELTQEYISATKPDPRMFIDLFKVALQRAGRHGHADKTVNPTLILKPLTADDTRPNNPGAIGTALMSALYEEIINRTPQQPTLREQVRDKAIQLGLLSTVQNPKKPGNNTKTLAQCLDVNISAFALKENEEMRQLVQGWAEVFNTGLAADNSQIDPFLDTLEKNLVVLRSENRSFVTFADEAEAVNIASPEGPFQLSTICPVLFEKKPDGTYLVGDVEKGPFERNDRLVKATHFLASMTIPGFDSDFFSRHQSLTKTNPPPEEIQAVALVIGKDDTRKEDALLVLRSNVVPLPEGQAPAWKDDVRPALVVIGNGPISPAVQSQYDLSNKKDGSRLITYIDASKGIAVDSMMAGLRRDDTHVKPILEQLGQLLKPEVLEQVLLPPPKSSFHQFAGKLTKPEETDAVKVERVLKEIMKGDYVKTGYVVVNLPTKTAEIIAALKSVSGRRGFNRTNTTSPSP